jgi:hypothetical protein
VVGEVYGGFSHGERTESVKRRHVKIKKPFSDSVQDLLTDTSVLLNACPCPTKMQRLRSATDIPVEIQQTLEGGPLLSF